MTDMSVDHSSGWNLPVEAVETHAAAVLFVGDRAYKVKKPVNLGFLDFSTRDARRVACEREWLLNRRFAPDVYLGVADLRGPDPTESEPVVVMRRLPADRRLSTLIYNGEPVDEEMRAIARILASAHARAERAPEISAEGGRDALRRRWDANLSEVADLGVPALVDGDPKEVADLVNRYLAGRGALFDKRTLDGRIVDGHGDLLAQDIFCLDDGPRLLDCLEFNDRLRFVDGLDDAAFLAMDLEHLGAPGTARRFLRWYHEFSADPAPPSLRHHYIAYRAFVRAKVALIRARQTGRDRDPASERLLRSAVRHLRLAQPRLVLVGGLPASGKSVLSGALADRFGMSLLSSDRLRKELNGIPPDQPAPARLDQGIYSREQTERTYGALIERAVALLARGESIVLDATWSDARHRELAAEAAEAAYANLVTIRCVVNEDVARYRLAQRGPGQSDADQDIAARLAGRTDPWPDATALDTSAPFGAVVRQAVDLLMPGEVENDNASRRPYMEPD